VRAKIWRGLDFALALAGCTKLIDAFRGADANSVVFQGQSGYLDHARPHRAA